MVTLADEALDHTTQYLRIYSRRCVSMYLDRDKCNFDLLYQKVAHWSWGMKNEEAVSCN